MHMHVLMLKKLAHKGPQFQEKELKIKKEELKRIIKEAEHYLIEAQLREVGGVTAREIVRRALANTFYSPLFLSNLEVDIKYS